eukprot:9271763-Pyramimonas_sp.AAC.1
MAALSASGVALAEMGRIEAVRVRVGIPAPCPPCAQCLIDKTSTRMSCVSSSLTRGDGATTCGCGPCWTSRHADLAGVHAGISA